METDYNYSVLNQLTDETTAGAATYYTWTADGEMATRHDPAWTYFAWDVDESLMEIAVPKHSPTLGQRASWQTVWTPRQASRSRVDAT